MPIFDSRHFTIGQLFLNLACTLELITMITRMVLGIDIDQIGEMLYYIRLRTTIYYITISFLFI